MYKFSWWNELLKQTPSDKRIVVVLPEGESCFYAISRVLNEHLASFVLVVREQTDEYLNLSRSYPDKVAFRMAASPEEASLLAVRLIHDGEGDVLMKGLVSTDVLLKAILHNEYGLLPAGKVISHITVADIPTYSKMLFCMDVAVIPYPTLDQFVQMIGYATDTCRKLDIVEPRIALIHCNEHLNERIFPFTGDYEKLKLMAKEGRWGDVILDGPMDAKTACDIHSAKVKHIDSPIEGEADVLIFPDILAGNTFYKTITLFAKAEVAGMVVGARCPIVVPSRGDSKESKYNSILLALLTACPLRLCVF